MNGADYLILGVLAFFACCWACIRGFVRESIGVARMAGRLMAGMAVCALVEPLLGGMIDEPPVSTWAARTLIVIGVLIVGWLVAAVLGYLLRHSGLSLVVDRLLGYVFRHGARRRRGRRVCVAGVNSSQLDQREMVEGIAAAAVCERMAGWIQTFAETGMKRLKSRA